MDTTARHEAHRPDAAARPVRLNAVGVAAWVALVASLAWLIADTAGDGWPLLAVAASAVAVLKVVDDSWVSRSLRRSPR